MQKKNIYKKIITSSKSYIRISLSVLAETKRLRIGEYLIHVMLPSCLSYSSITGSIKVSSSKIKKNDWF